MVNDELWKRRNMGISHGTNVRWISFGFLQFHECVVENERANAICTFQRDALRPLKRWIRSDGVFITWLTDGFNFILRGSKQENQILWARHGNIDKKCQK